MHKKEFKGRIVKESLGELELKPDYDERINAIHLEKGYLLRVLGN